MGILYATALHADNLEGFERKFAIYMSRRTPFI